MNCLNCKVDLLEIKNNWKVIENGKMVDCYCDKCFNKNTIKKRVKVRKPKGLPDKLNYILRTRGRKIEMIELIE